jgi:hypothetical protein
VFGAIDRNRYHNVPVMAVEKPLTLLESMSVMLAACGAGRGAAS